MERKIYRSLMLVSLITLITTTIILAFLFYEFYIDLIESELEHIGEIYLETNRTDIKTKRLIGNDIQIGVYSPINLPKEEDNFVTHTIAISEYEFLQIKRPIRILEYILFPSLLIFFSLVSFVFVFLHMVSAYLSDNLMKPIRLATESMENILVDKIPSFNNIYPELQPFIASMNLYKENTNYYVSKLKENEVYRREFTANVSHELKTPLTSINGYAEMIKSGMARREDIPKLAGIIHEEGLRLLDMIESIIELSTLEEPSLNIEFRELNLFQIVQDISYKLKTRLIHKNIEMSVTGSNVLIKANHRMINDLIFNLLDNAIKYNKDNGMINIHTAPFQDRAILIIEDSGIGISEDNLDRIFERFYIVDKSRSGKNRSTGLGLSIVKHILEIHGASIEITSQLNKGTKIKIIF